MKNTHPYIAGLLVIVLAFLFVPVQSERANAQYNVDCYMEQGGSKFVCDNGGEIELQTGAVLDVQSGATTTFGGAVTIDDLSIGGNLDVTGWMTTTQDATVGADLILTAADAISVTNGATITPTGSYQPLESAGAVGFGAIAIAPAGTLLTLINTVNQTITITDTGTLKLSGDAALGQYDAIQLFSDGTNWIQIASESDN